MEKNGGSIAQTTNPRRLATTIVNWNRTKKAGPFRPAFAIWQHGDCYAERRLYLSDSCTREHGSLLAVSRISFLIPGGRRQLAMYRIVLESDPLAFSPSLLPYVFPRLCCILLRSGIRRCRCPLC